MSDKPWTRRDDETDAAWQAFQIFRDLGLTRTIEKAWRQYADSRDLVSDQSQPHFHEWKDDHDWYDRVEKYDAHVDEHRRKQLIEARNEALKNLATQAVPAASILALLAVDRADEHEAARDLDDDQRWAIRELLDRIGVQSPDELQISGEVTQDRAGLDLAMFRDFVEMDDEERSDRIDALDKMRDELEDDDLGPEDPDEDG